MKNVQTRVIVRVNGRFAGSSAQVVRMRILGKGISEFKSRVEICKVAPIGMVISGTGFAVKWRIYERL